MGKAADNFKAQVGTVPPNLSDAKPLNFDVLVAALLLELVQRVEGLERLVATATK